MPRGAVYPSWGAVQPQGSIVQNNQKFRCKYWVTHSSICSCACTAHSLAPHCSLCTACFTRALRCAHSFTCSLTYSRTHGKVNVVLAVVASFFSVPNHSHLVNLIPNKQRFGSSWFWSRFRASSSDCRARVLVSELSFEWHRFMSLVLFCSDPADLSKVPLAWDVRRMDDRTDRQTDRQSLW